MMYGVAAFGWTVGVYILQMLWENVRTILLSYQSYVAWYAVITGLISFISKKANTYWFYCVKKCIL